jgi:hypothetical protein
MNSTEKYLKNFNPRLWSLLKYHLGIYETDFKFPLFDKYDKIKLKYLQLEKKSI